MFIYIYSANECKHRSCQKLSKHHLNTEWKITENESHPSMMDGLYMNNAVLHAAIQRNSHTHFIFTHVQWFNTQLFYITDKILKNTSVVLVSCAILYMAAWDRPGKRWYMFTEFDSLKMTIHVGIISSSFAINTHRYRHNMSQSYQPITFRFH